MATPLKYRKESLRSFDYLYNSNLITIRERYKSNNSKLKTELQQESRKISLNKFGLRQRILKSLEISRFNVIALELYASTSVVPLPIYTPTTILSLSESRTCKFVL